MVIPIIQGGGGSGAVVSNPFTFATPVPERTPDQVQMLATTALEVEGKQIAQNLGDRYAFHSIVYVRVDNHRQKQKKTWNGRRNANCSGIGVGYLILETK